MMKPIRLFRLACVAFLAMAAIVPSKLAAKETPSEPAATPVVSAIPGNHPAGADESFRIAGPGGPDIVSYLSTTKVDCIDSDRSDCPIGSILNDAETFYGKFPGDPADYVVAFLFTRTGGNAVDMKAVVFKGDSWNSYSLVGTAADIYGADPREVRFLAGRTITWVGTFAAPGDTHAQPTGKKTFRLIVGEKAVRFLDR